MLFYIFLIVNKSHEKTKPKNVLVHLFIFSDFPFCDTALQAHWFYHLTK